MDGPLLDLLHGAGATDMAPPLLDPTAARVAGMNRLLYSQHKVDILSSGSTESSVSSVWQELLEVALVDRPELQIRGPQPLGDPSSLPASTSYNQAKGVPLRLNDDTNRTRCDDCNLLMVSKVSTPFLGTGVSRNVPLLVCEINRNNVAKRAGKGVLKALCHLYLANRAFGTSAGMYMGGRAYMIFRINPQGEITVQGRQWPDSTNALDFAAWAGNNTALMDTVPLETGDGSDRALREIEAVVRQSAEYGALSPHADPIGFRSLSAGGMPHAILPITPQVPVNTLDSMHAAASVVLKKVESMSTLSKSSLKTPATLGSGSGSYAGQGPSTSRMRTASGSLPGPRHTLGGSLSRGLERDQSFNHSASAHSAPLITPSPSQATPELKLKQAETRRIETSALDIEEWARSHKYTDGQVASSSTSPSPDNENTSRCSSDFSLDDECIDILRRVTVRRAAVEFPAPSPSPLPTSWNHPTWEPSPRQEPMARQRTRSFEMGGSDVVTSDLIQLAEPFLIGGRAQVLATDRTDLIDLWDDDDEITRDKGTAGVAESVSKASEDPIAIEAEALENRRQSVSGLSQKGSPVSIRRLTSNSFQGPTEVGFYPRRSSSPHREKGEGGEQPASGESRDRGHATQGVRNSSTTMPFFSSSSYDEKHDQPLAAEPFEINDGGDSEWGSYKQPPRLSGAESSLAGMTKKFGLGLASLSNAVKATDTLKSKWKTVVGPGTFSGSPTSPSSFASGSGSNANNFAALRFGLDMDKAEELERPTPTAQPIAITSSTPFHYINGGSSGWAAPTGAPGFRNPNGLISNLAPLTGTENGHERIEDWSGTKLVGRREMTVPVLDEHCADALRPALPARQRLSNVWTLLFSLDQHGGSVSTFYRLIEMHAQTHKFAGNLLVIRDTHDRRFGVYMNESIRRLDGSYYGSGESWLFKIVGNDLDVRARTFKWTGRNQYFALCEGTAISFGGGDGKTGLYLDASFLAGSSARCPAYENEVLCAIEGSPSLMGKFECVGLEVWGTS